MIRKIEGTSARLLEYLDCGYPEEEIPVEPVLIRPINRIRPRWRFARRTAVVCVGLWFLAVFIGLVVVQRYAEMAKVGYDLSDLEAQAAAMEEENHVLKISVANLESPGRIYQIATTKLGMVRPKGFEVAAVTAGPGLAVNQDSSVPEGSSESRLVKAGKRLLSALAGPGRAEAKGVR